MKLSVLASTAILAAVSGRPTVRGRSPWTASTGHPDYFTSAYVVKATPDAVVDSNNTATGGLAGAAGVYKYAINSELDIICYDITITGFQGDYQSPALTATHIHQGDEGKAGPPRIALPNPVDNGQGARKSSGCVKGPFTTGVKAVNGSDTGAGFKVASIEEDPAAFFTDVHSSLAPAGAVRGQIGHAAHGMRRRDAVRHDVRAAEDC